jgi:hypothetical protein
LEQSQVQQSASYVPLRAEPTEHTARFTLEDDRSSHQEMSPLQHTAHCAEDVGSAGGIRGEPALPGDTAAQARHSITSSCSSSESVNVFDIVRAHRVTSGASDRRGDGEGGQAPPAAAGPNEFRDRGACFLDPPALLRNGLDSAYQSQPLRRNLEESNSEARSEGSEAINRAAHSYTEASWPSAAVAAQSADYGSEVRSSANMTSRMTTNDVVAVSLPSYPSSSGPPALSPQPTVQHPYRAELAVQNSPHSIPELKPPLFREEPASAQGNSEVTARDICDDVTGLTFDRVVTCAQQLISVMRPGDHVTPEQRLMLEQLASLSSLTSQRSADERRPENELLARESRLQGDQANKLAFFQEQRVQAFTPHPGQPNPPNQPIRQSEASSHSSSQSQSPAQPSLTGEFHAILNSSAGSQHFIQSQIASCAHSAPCPTQSREKLANPSEVGSAGAGASGQAPRTPVQRGTINKQHDGGQNNGGCAETKNSDPSNKSELAACALVESLQRELVRQGTPHRTGVSSSVTSATELRAARREPTEDEDEAEVTELCAVHVLQSTELQLERQGVSREATENDERLDNPDHVCLSDSCTCSLRPR